MNLLEIEGAVDNIFEDREKIFRLKKLLGRRLRSVWCDEFERGYFDTWIKLINHLSRGLGEADGGKEEGVDKNPDEEEEGDKTP